MTIRQFSQMTRRAFLSMVGVSALGAALPNLISSAENIPFRVPPTLMFHTKDRWKMPRILAWLRDEGYESVGYADLLKALEGKSALPEKPVIITIDDIASNYIQPYFLAMADEMEKVGYRGVFGVVTRHSPARSPKVWAQLRELVERSWELDTHTTHHSLLPSLSMADLREEIVESAQWIAEGTGRAPLTLIAPYGAVYRRGREFDPRIFEVAAEANLAFVVGIVGGRFISAESSAPHYVGRVGIGTDHVQTAWWIEHFHRES